MIHRLVLRTLRAREFKVAVPVVVVFGAQLLLFGATPLPGGRGTLLVLEWTLTACVGCCYSMWFVRDTLLDLDVLHASGRNGDSENTALILIIAALLLLVVHLLFLGLGIPGLLSPPAPASATVAAQVYGTTYTVIGQLLVYGLSLIHRLRGQLLATYTRRSS